MQHLGLNLVWQPGLVVEAELQQRRRLRTGTEHYFDHPRLGVLAIVERVDYPPAEDSGSPPAGAP